MHRKAGTGHRNETRKSSCQKENHAETAFATHFVLKLERIDLMATSQINQATLRCMHSNHPHMHAQATLRIRASLHWNYLPQRQFPAISFVAVKNLSGLSFGRKNIALNLPISTFVHSTKCYQENLSPFSKAAVYYSSGRGREKVTWQ